LTQPYLLHALSPLHAGTGQSVDAIELPIARMRSTGIPFVPGSSIKGVLRDERRPPKLDPAEWAAVFGPDKADQDKPDKASDDHAGAIVLGDARLVLLPVRSFLGVFAWVTSPLWLILAKRDLEGVPDPDVPATVPSIDRIGARVASRQVNKNVYEDNGTLYLEDLDLPVAEDETLAAWGDFFAKRIAPVGHPDIFTKRFVVVDDETMTFLAETATQLDTRVRLDSGTRVVAKGALWTEECLPPESVLIGVIGADRSRRKETVLKPTEVIDKALPNRDTAFQFGGKATTGHGRCRLVRLGEVKE